MTHADHAGFLNLHNIADAEQREALWRQSMATLAAAVSNSQRSVPLEGIPGELLSASIRVALQEGYFDRLTWLSSSAAAAAMYEIAAALPASAEKRELGKKVLEKLKQGDAATFVGLAIRLALGTPRVISSAPMRARIIASLNAPRVADLQVDALALALISRRELCRQWLLEPSSSSLPNRRLAAQVLECAAAEAARLAAVSDDSGIRVFSTSGIRKAWDRLLSDREPLVWRHAARARGLLAHAIPRLHDEIERSLSPHLSATEWRRAATSAAACITMDPKTGTRWCRSLLSSMLYDQDPGLAACMIGGMARAAHSHPQIVEDLLSELIKSGGTETFQAFCEMRRELGDPAFASAAQIALRSFLNAESNRVSTSDVGTSASFTVLHSELAPTDVNGEAPLSQLLSQALNNYVKKDAASASQAAQKILSRTETTLDRLESFESASRESLIDLLYLDQVLLADPSLRALLQFETEDGENPRLGNLHQRLTNWLVIAEGDPAEKTAPERVSARLIQLRALLHLADADGPDVDNRTLLLRQRRMLVARVLLQRLRSDANSVVARALYAAIARVLDALVREEGLEIFDVVIAAALFGANAQGVDTLGEASMIPDLKQLLRAYAQLLRATQERDPNPGRNFEALQSFADQLPTGTSTRVEAFRKTLLDILRELRPISNAHSLLEFAEVSSTSALSRLAEQCSTLQRIFDGSLHRLGEAQTLRPASTHVLDELGISVERFFRSGAQGERPTAHEATHQLRQDLIGAFGQTVALHVERLMSRPIEAPRSLHPSVIPPAEQMSPLPRWVPANRIVGGFYLMRPVGVGAVGSVFVAKRFGEHEDLHSPAFALKVPDYSGAVARTLSEEEFLRLFREEAGALLALPEHPNIARFVTFDVGARPKPILVMELVEGSSLERILSMDNLSMTRALDLLQGIAAGLDAMHQVGVAHLDLKPSNIIVRESGDISSADATTTPVLVDFGLAGRKIRPGCGTAQYGAPEVWGAYTGASATPADVYAFGCLIYEVLFANTLYNAPNEMAAISMHVQNDGGPPIVHSLARQPQTAALAQLLQRCLRKNPTDRITIRQARQFLTNLVQDLADKPWPLPIESIALLRQA